MIVLVAGGLLGIVAGGALSGFPGRLAPGLWLQAAGAFLLGAAGLWALCSDGTWGSSFTSELSPHAGIDGLTGLFLATLALVACPGLAYASAYLPRTTGGRVTGVLSAAFLLALIGVLCARDALSFLFFWELMTLLPAAIILAGSATEAARHTVFAYVAITHLGGAGTWIALLLLAHEGALGDSAALTEGSGIQAVIAVAAIVGFGTKAGLMPMHAWLPRAHPIAPAYISALMSGVMVAVAAYGLIRVLVDWLGPAPAWVGATVLVLGGLSALGGITYALFQRDLKRLLAYSTVEHLGVIALGVGACLLLRRHGADQWAAFALGAALLHTVNHAAFKALLFLGAGTFERATGGLELDRLGGLLRRLPWSGGAFLVGALAIAGIPLLNGFASEWLTLQALLHVPAYAGVWDGTLGALALAALGGTMALAVLCFVKVIGLVLLGPPRRSGCADAVEPPRAMRLSLVALAGACLVLGTVPGLLFSQLTKLAPWPDSGDVAVRPGLELPGTGNLPTVGFLVVVLGLTSLLWLARGNRRAAPSPTWASGQLIEAPLLWTSAGFSKPLRLVLEAVLRPEREIETTTKGGVVQEVSYAGRVPHLIDDHLYRPITDGALLAASWARRLQSGRLGTYVVYLIGLVVVLLLAVRHRGDRMTVQTAVSGVVQVVGGVALSPLLIGVTQQAKARLQGRRGPGPLQPYRELRRLWGKSGVDVEGTTLVYRLAPVLVAAAMGAAILLVPVAGVGPGLGVGHDALALAGLLALARLAVCAAAWDTSNGFALQGASRDLTLSVFVEAALVLSLAVAALVAGTTDLRGIVAGTAGGHPWSTPALGLAAVAFALVVIAETGRQPVDNPDTHLELTMIHEGPILEFAGRDQALLQWALAARHWLVLVLAAGVFLPHPKNIWGQLALLPASLVVLCVALALTESLIAKMRILLVPRLIGVGAAVALLGVVTWLVDAL